MGWCVFDADGENVLSDGSSETEAVEMRSGFVSALAHAVSIGFPLGALPQTATDADAPELG